MSRNRHNKRRREQRRHNRWLKRHSSRHGVTPHGVKFYDVTLTFQGSVASIRQYDSSAVHRASVALFASILEAGQGVDFTVPLPVMDLSLRWTSMTGTAATATFLWRNLPVTTSALLSGVDPAEDDILAAGLQKHLILQMCHETPFEPGFYLPNAVERPLLATVIVPNPLVPPEVLAAVGAGETCLAAAFFEKILVGSK
jgi:hypothetical protein